jgi:hypothetical protein
VLRLGQDEQLLYGLEVGADPDRQGGQTLESVHARTYAKTA